MTNEIIDNDLNVLQEYKDQQKIMMGMIMKIVRTLLGHVPELYIDNNRIKIRYNMCPCKIKHDEERFNSHLITSHHMQRDTLNAKMKDIYDTDLNRLVIAKM